MPSHRGRRRVAPVARQLVNFVVYVLFYFFAHLLLSIMADSLEWNNQSDVSNQSVTSAHPIRYPREASYFAAACAILFVIVGILGTKKKQRGERKKAALRVFSLFFSVR